MTIEKFDRVGLKFLLLLFMICMLRNRRNESESRYPPLTARYREKNVCLTLVCSFTQYAYYNNNKTLSPTQSNFFIVATQTQKETYKIIVYLILKLRVLDPENDIFCIAISGLFY